jgi:hypothetical protein
MGDILSCRESSAGFRKRQRNDFGVPAGLHDGRDPFRRAVRDGAKRVVLQMAVALRGSGLTMPKQLADSVTA